jgi:YesN/AraC family two-component response regulator
MNKKSIVVADDDDFIRKTFFMILHQNYCVHLAKDADEVFAHFKNRGIDLIITDLKLPRLSGLEMISILREDGYEGDLILISAYPDLIHRETLQRYSIKHFFIKPLDLKTLKHSIDSLMCPRD